MLTREQIAQRAARELAAGEKVYLGGPLATLAAEKAGSEVNATTSTAEAVDAAVLEAEQVSAGGALAVASDLAEGAGAALRAARRVIVVMTHVTPDGKPRIVEACDGPVGGARSVHRIVTDMAVIDVRPEGLVLREVAPGKSASDVQEVTGAALLAAPDMDQIRL